MAGLKRGPISRLYQGTAVGGAVFCSNGATLSAFDSDAMVNDVVEVIYINIQSSHIFDNKPLITD